MRRFTSVARAVAWRQIHNFTHNPAFLLPSIIFPLFFFTAFAGGLSNVSNAPGFDFPSGYTAFQFVFVLLQSAAFGGVFTGFSVAADFERGFARRLMLAAPNRLGILGGYLLAGLVRALIVGVLLFAVALIVGMQIDGGAVDLFGLIVLALIVNLIAALFAFGVAFRLRTIQAGPAMQMPVFLILFFAPVYVPLALLAGWVAGRRQGQPVHRADRGRPRPDLGPVVRRAPRLRDRGRRWRAVLGLGRARAAQGRGGRLGRQHARQLAAAADPELAVDRAEVVLDRLRAEEQRGGDLAVGAALGDLERDLELLGGQLVGGDGGRGRAGRAAGGAQLRARALGPRLGAEALEHRERGAERGARVGAALGAAQALAVEQLGARGLERLARLARAARARGAKCASTSSSLAISPRRRSTTACVQVCSGRSPWRASSSIRGRHLVGSPSRHRTSIRSGA